MKKCGAITFTLFLLALTSEIAISSHILRHSGKQCVLASTYEFTRQVQFSLQTQAMPLSSVLANSERTIAVAMPSGNTMIRHMFLALRNLIHSSAQYQKAVHKDLHPELNRVLPNRLTGIVFLPFNHEDLLLEQALMTSFGTEGRLYLAKNSQNSIYFDTSLIPAGEKCSVVALNYRGDTLDEMALEGSHYEGSPTLETDLKTFIKKCFRDLKEFD